MKHFLIALGLVFFTLQSKATSPVPGCSELESASLESSRFIVLKLEEKSYIQNSEDYFSVEIIPGGDGFYTPCKVNLKKSSVSAIEAVTIKKAFLLALATKANVGFKVIAGADGNGSRDFDPAVAIIVHAPRN